MSRRCSPGRLWRRGSPATRARSRWPTPPGRRAARRCCSPPTPRPRPTASARRSMPSGATSRAATPAHARRRRRRAGAGPARWRRSPTPSPPSDSRRASIGPRPRSTAVTSRAVTTLEGKTLFISGGSRGIGLAIALRAAADGANIALIAQTAEPHPKLEGTVYTAAEAIEAAGGTALPIVGDIRDEAAVTDAVAAAVAKFGGIDVVVNNASAIDLRGTEALDLKRYDLMQDINTRGTFTVTKACVGHLREAANPHILPLSPPIGLKPQWLGPHIAYTIAKYGMSLCALGWAEEFREAGIASNALWPRTLVATAAVQNLLGGDAAMARARKPQVYADAAHAILTRPSRECTGNTYLCEDVLAEEGITDLSPYAYVEGAELQVDLFVEAV